MGPEYDDVATMPAEMAERFRGLLDDAAADSLARLRRLRGFPTDIGAVTLLGRPVEVHRDVDGTHLFDVEAGRTYHLRLTTSYLGSMA